jgi:hypothetical protein
MRARSPVLVVALTAVLATAGCAPLERTDLHDIDWIAVAGRDLNCPGDVHLVGRDYHDIGATRDDEAFVTMRCTQAGETRPEHGQLEVFLGGSDRRNPTRIAVMVRISDGMTLDGCVVFRGHQAFTRDATGKSAVEASWVTAKDKKLTFRPRPTAPAAMPGCS